MRRNSTKEVEEKVVEPTPEVKKEWNLEEAFALWAKHSKDGSKYYEGIDCNGNKLIAFINSKKKNPKEPDIQVNEVIGEGNKGRKLKQVAALWSKEAKNKNVYLSGNTTEKEYLVGWYNKHATKENMQPSIRVYFQEESK